MQKKRFTLLFLLLISFGGLLQSIAQELNYDWAQTIGGPDAINVIGRKIVVDAAGNTYSTGVFAGTADFDPGPGTANLTAAGFDSYIAKYDPNGNYIWAKTMTSTRGVGISAITLDQSGDILIGGQFSGVVDFDLGTGTASRTGTSTNNSSVSENVFIAKYDANGNYLWVKTETGNGGSQSMDMVTDAAGNAYLTGLVYGSVDFGAGFSFTGISNEPDIFIAKYNAGGNLVWARSIGGDNSDYSNAITVDYGGNVYITGAFKSTIVDFDPGPDSAQFLGGGAGSNTFIAKYTSNGNYVWAKRIESSNESSGQDITCDALGNLYFIGNFKGEIDMDPDFSVVDFISNGEQDIFLSKYDTGGHYIWARSIGGIGVDGGNSVICVNGSLYIQGGFVDTIDFDPAATTARLTSASENGNGFIGRYDLNGHYLWAGSLRSVSTIGGLGLCMDNSNNLYSTGLFGGSADFDPGPIDAYKTASGLYFPFGWNAFIVKLHADCKQFLGFTESNCDSFVFNGNAYTTSGTYIDTFLTSANCDSISTLHLTITGRTSVNEQVTGHYCDSVIFNGITYKTSGVYTQHYSNITGCDSNFVYNLDIGQISTTTSASYAACDSFVINDTLVFTTSLVQSVAFTNASGCDSVAILDITINPSPQAGITANGTTLIASGIGNYQWIDCNDNKVISGAIAQEYSPSASGSYAVVVTSAGCSDTSDCMEVNTTASIHGLGNADKVNLYPNPATSKITLQSTQGWNNATIRLLNTLGQSLSEYTNLKGRLFTIDIAAFPTGIYILELSTAHETARVKFIKE